MADDSDLRLVPNRRGGMSLVHEGRAYKLKRAGRQKYWRCSKKSFLNTCSSLSKNPRGNKALLLVRKQQLRNASCTLVFLNGKQWNSN
ncbi:hypothetical protein T03_6935 [Trichinella britovi]|uniref:FLYWCH-type domain-containing protein n=2 Tax=Trichinella TaxID=6333 RepID=A0A0V1CIY3_TRIBR|nr:hypothetical protein T03_6935 [Trichinella britovi]